MTSSGVSSAAQSRPSLRCCSRCCDVTPSTRGMRMSDQGDDRPRNLPIVEPQPTGRGEGTRAAHAPRPPAPPQEPLGLPTYRTSAFRFDTAQDYADVLGDRKPGYSYSRVDNPT